MYVTVFQCGLPEVRTTLTVLENLPRPTNSSPSSVWSVWDNGEPGKDMGVGRRA